MAESIQSLNVGRSADLRRTARIDAVRVMVLGVNAWAVLLLIPWALGDPEDGTSLFWLLGPLTALAVGVPLILSHRLFAAWVLLGVYPVLCAFGVAFLPQLTRHAPHGTFGLALGALCFVAYGAGSALSVGRPPSIRESTHKPLGTVAPVEERAERRWGRRILLGVTGALSFGLALVAPRVGDGAAYLEAWGEAAREGATLTAVVGGALGAALLALVVGPGLRVSRAHARNVQRSNRRATMMFGLFVVGLMLFAFYETAR
jgi:hypothetical protein